jgi:Avidin family
MRSCIVVLLILFCFVGFDAEASEPVDFSGVWWSARCARVTLSPVGDLLSGHYSPKIGSADDQSFELTGLRSGPDLIAFIVSVGPNGPIIAWAGQHTVQNGEQLIIMKWHMTVDVPDEEENEDTILAAVWTGADTFKRPKPSFCP